MGVTVNDHTLGTSPRLGGSRQSKSWNIGAGAIESFDITSIDKILKASSSSLAKMLRYSFGVGRKHILIPHAIR
jgi:hypothetical protein